MKKLHSFIKHLSAIALGTVLVWMSVYAVQIPTSLNNAIQYIMETVWTSDGTASGTTNVQVWTGGIYIATGFLSNGNAWNNMSLGLDASGNVVYVPGGSSTPIFSLASNFIPKLDSLGTALEISVMYQSGGLIGVNTTNPTRSVNILGDFLVETQGSNVTYQYNFINSNTGLGYPPVDINTAPRCSCDVTANAADCTTPSFASITDQGYYCVDLTVQNNGNYYDHNVYTRQTIGIPSPVLATSGANVGVNTNNPQASLDVSGNVMISTTPAGLNSWDVLTINPTTREVSTRSAGSFAGTPGWALVGNGGTNPATNFIGTTDNQAFVIRTNNVENFRVTADGSLLASGNIGTTPASGPGTRFMWIPEKGAIRAGTLDTSAGGAWNSTFIGQYSAVFGNNNMGFGTGSFVGGVGNAALGNYTTAFGSGNIVSSHLASILGGFANNIQGNSDLSVIGGGSGNIINAILATIGGGELNYALGYGSTVGGGVANAATGTTSTIAGGTSNFAPGDDSFIGGGSMNAARGYRSSVVGGRNNQATGDYTSIAGGLSNTVSGIYGFIGGGLTNSITSSTESVIGGGSYNRILANSNGSVIVGGSGNVIDGQFGSTIFIGGGNSNTGSWANAVVVGGSNNQATQNSFVGGGLGNRAIGSPIIFGPSNVVVGGNFNTAQGIAGFIGGGVGNVTMGSRSTVPGGYQNTGAANYSTIGGGIQNTINTTAANSTIGGGQQNTINLSVGDSATIAGGKVNSISARYATIAGGWNNIISGITSFIGGGYQNTAAGQNSVIAGGENNIANGDFSSIPGGHSNQTIGSYSFAAGQNAIASGDNSFVWNDGTTPQNSNIYNNEFRVSSDRILLGRYTPALDWAIQAYTGANFDIGLLGTTVADTLWIDNSLIQNLTVTNSYFGPSDSRLKTNINPGISWASSALSIVNNLNPVTYQWADNSLTAGFGFDYNKLHYGFIAQEVESVIPELVVENDQLTSLARGLEGGGIKSLNTLEIIPILTQAIKEQQAIIDDLTNRIEALETP